MAVSKTVETVTKIVKPAIEALGLKLWDVRFLKEGASWYLRVYIDSENGIDINNCTDVSHAIDPLIDEADPIDKAYFLEVCSPGLNRELITPEHFEAMVGKPVAIHTVREENGQRDIFGKLICKSRDGVKIETENGEITIGSANISSVKLNDDNF